MPQLATIYSWKQLRLFALAANFVAMVAHLGIHRCPADPPGIEERGGSVFSTRAQSVCEKILSFTENTLRHWGAVWDKYLVSTLRVFHSCHCHILGTPLPAHQRCQIHDIFCHHMRCRHGVGSITPMMWRATSWLLLHGPLTFCAGWWMGPDMRTKKGTK